MGKFYTIACHVRGNRTIFFDIQKEYFILLNQPRDYFSINTSCVGREEYISLGQSLWHSVTFIPIQENKVDGKFIEYDIKWGSYCHQWKLLSDILTKFNYSWQHMLLDQYDETERKIVITNNESKIKNFDHNVQSYFIEVDTHIEPIKLEFIETNELWGE